MINYYLGQITLYGGLKMGKFKDLIYDISDILTAVVIVLIAGIVIWVSIGNIMEYPSIIAEEQSKQNTNFGLAVPVGEGEGSSDENNAAAVSGTAIEGEGTENTDNDPEIYAIYINYGESMSTIASKFVSVGLFESEAQFTSLVTQMNAETSIKTGNFIIPSNATPEEVIEILTTSPGL